MMSKAYIEFTKRYQWTKKSGLVEVANKKGKRSVHLEGSNEAIELFSKLSTGDRLRWLDETRKALYKTKSRIKKK